MEDVVYCIDEVFLSDRTFDLWTIPEIDTDDYTIEIDATDGHDIISRLGLENKTAASMRINVNRGCLGSEGLWSVDY